jgi:hypothetical protein
VTDAATRGMRFVEQPSDLTFECVDLIGPQHRWMDGVGAARGTDPPRGSAAERGNHGVCVAGFFIFPFQCVAALCETVAVRPERTAA